MGRVQLASLGTGVAQTPTGAVVPGAPGTIVLHGTNTAVTIWTQEVGGSANVLGTFTTDSFGRIPGWVDTGQRIDITIAPAPTITADFGETGEELIANKGQPSGYASLDGGGSVPSAQLSNVAAALPDASSTTKGVLKLTGDLGGTAATPTVPGLASKYVKPGGGIPETDLDVATQGKLDAGNTGYQKPVGGIPEADLAAAVQAKVDAGSTAYQKAGSGIPEADLAAAAQTKLDAGGTAYQKPGLGIPETDLASAAQTKLDAGGTAYQKPVGGIPEADLASAVQTKVDAGNTAYQKPVGGIPEGDLASGVQTKVDAGGTAYQKPVGGIPETDLTAAVQTKVDSGGTAYQKPVGGIPEGDLSSAVQTKVDAGGTSYQKPVGGIPETDLASAVQTKVDAGNTAYQKPVGGIPEADLASAVQTKVDAGGTAYQKPVGGVPKTDLTAAAQASLTSADTAVQSVNAKTGTSVTLNAGDVGALTQVTADGRYVHQDGTGLPADVVVDVAGSPKSIDSTGVTTGQVLGYESVSGKFKPVNPGTAATPVQRVPYSVDSPFNQVVVGAPSDATSSAVVSALSLNQWNFNQNVISANVSGLMSSGTDPTTQFALPLFDAAKATAKVATGETGLLAVYVAGVFSQVLSRTSPITRTNSYSQEISVPGNWGDLVSDGSGDNNAEVVNWATGEEWSFHSLAQTVSKVLPAAPVRQAIGTVVNSAGTVSYTFTTPAGGVPQGCLVTVITSSHTTANPDETASVTDARGNTYTKVASAVNFATGNREQCDLWASFIGTALIAGDVITVTTIAPNFGEGMAAWYTNTQGGTLDVAAASTTGTASVTTTAPNDLVITATSQISSAYSYAGQSPWTAGASTGAGDPDNGFATDAYQVLATASTVTTPNAGTDTSSPFRAVALAAFKMSAAVQAGTWPVGSTIINTNSPVWYTNTDKMRIGTPGGTNWETVTLSAGANLTTDPVTVTAFANPHPSGDLVIDCWTTTSLASTGVTTLTVPRAALYLNNGPQHLVLELGEANQETVLVSSVSGTTVTLTAPTTKTHSANCSIAAISATNTAYANATTGVNYDGVPPRSSAANSQFSNSGSGTSYLAGCITAFDIGRGVINHAIGIVLMDGAPNINTDGTFNSGGSGPSAYFVFPATYSDQNAFRSVSGAGWTSGTASGTSLLNSTNAGNSVDVIAGEQVIVGYGTANAETLTIQTVVDGTHLKFTASLAHTHASGEYITPAGAVPMGARFRLKQSYIPPAGKSALFYMVVDALKRYGCFFRDGSGHTKLVFESQITAKWGTGTVPAIVPADLGLIPWNSMELLQMPA